ncbi:MAG: hypothetical protein K0R89_616 [Ramlibacter sp.]|nr:hypothetical protein [Ramlibacter sp.]
MKDGKPMDTGEPDRRPVAGPGSRGSGPRKQRGFVERATAVGHSGHGAESVRPHLRDQLRLKALLPTPFPTSAEQQDIGKDEHHR